MKIEVNGSSVDLGVASVRDLLDRRNIDTTQSGVAVAVNDRVIRRTEWETTELRDGDRVEIIVAMAGG